MVSTPAEPRRFSRSLLRFLVFCLLASVFFYVAVSIFVAHVLTRSQPRQTSFNAGGGTPEVAPWTVQTADGLTLKGWYLTKPGGTPKTQRLIVLVHGMGGSLDEMAEIGRDLHALGYDVLLFDLRGHGTSDESRLYMGRRERVDIRAVLAWARARGYPDSRIGWLGHSMGASTLLMEGEKDRSFHALVIDSAYGNLPELLDRQLTEHSHLPSLFNPGILLAARYVFGVRTDDLIPIDSARNWQDRPVLLIHGEADSVVPVEQARKIAASAGSNCRTMILPGVEHVGAYHADPVRYINAVDAFFTVNLP